LKFTGSGDDPNDDFVDMLGLIGTGLDEQIPAKGPKEDDHDNVIKVGTLAWVKADHNRRMDLRKRAARMRGR